MANSNPTQLLQEYLAEQTKLSAVEEFSIRHDNNDIQNKDYYKQLIPSRKPNAQEQFAFEVNLDKCSGCKSCVTGCHNKNGLLDDETWRSVGTQTSCSVTGGDFLQTITSACHHCLEPACMSGCPVLAYEKDSITGIVKHLDDQCIGCQYCVMKCPYGVPQFSKSIGIVRKCDMCIDRLQDDEAPACVQACPTEAIQIKLVELEQIRDESIDPLDLVSGHPNSNYTLPTTQYVSDKHHQTQHSTLSTEDFEVEEAHLPLVIMLVLSQYSLGMYVSSLLAKNVVPQTILIATSLLFAIVAMLIATAHLGRPQHAWKAFLGLRTSWISREMITFGVFIPLLCAILFSVSNAFGLVQLDHSLPSIAISTLKVCALIFGLLAVFSSIMVYYDTPRITWATPKTFGKFIGTTVLGSTTSLILLHELSINPLSSVQYWITGIALVTTIISKFILEYGIVFLSTDMAKDRQILGQIALLTTKLKTHSMVRIGLLSTSTILFVFAYLGQTSLITIMLTTVGTLTLLWGELLSRYLFFRSVVPPSMPGRFAP